MHDSVTERDPTTTRSLHALADDLGFRRIEAVSVRVGVSGASACVTGVVHRYSRTRRISLAMATRLVAAGAPLHLGPGSDQEIG